MHLRVAQQETKAPEASSAIETFCSAMKSRTKNRYEQALLYSRFSSAKAADAAVIALQDKQRNPATVLPATTSNGANGVDSSATTSTLTEALKSTSILTSDSDAVLESDSISGSPSLTCNQIYRNWHPEDLQRREKQIPSSSASTDAGATLGDNSTISSNEGGKPTTFLLSYPAEKYNIMRDEDLSPIANSYFNLLGLFFCATAVPIPPTTGDLSLKGKRTATFTAATTKPVETSPYGKARFQVPFQDLEHTLFPEFRLFFADFYKVKEDCLDQKYEYRVSSTPNLWTELLIGCDVIPTSEMGETVESLLHAKVRRTANTLSIHQERKQLATILEGVALDISQMAGMLRRRMVIGEGEEAEEEKQEMEMKELLEITYRLSRDRTRLGVLKAFRLKTPLDTIEE
ncbi:hypothetical protein BGW39_006047 [Mortierella sp. 14UC]|nr:hypothetical protein BGW39_006047 [Mortierella sp. 14UC]